MLMLERDPRGRPVVSVQALAGMLEYRLHRVGEQDLVLAGCGRAKRLGLAAVTCRPEHVAAAAQQLHGSGVGITSAVEFHDEPGRPLRVGTVVGQARQLALAGVSDVAIMADAGRIAGCAGWSAVSAEPIDVRGPAGAGVAAGEASSRLRVFAEVVAELVAALEPWGVRVRVHIDDSAMGEELVARTAVAVQQAGAWMVQVGTWRQDCAGFAAVQAVREVLDRSVLVKWTPPVRSLPTLLFALGQGVDRFNAQDVTRLLAEARRSAMGGPLTVPVAGLDY